MSRTRPSTVQAARKGIALLPVLLFLHCVAGSRAQAEVQARWWVSSADMHFRLSDQPAIGSLSGGSGSKNTIRIDPEKTYQTILGLGSSLEHSTCWNIRRLPTSRQEEVIESLVDAEKGIGMSLMRICIGTPDFTASPWYSYDDVSPGRTDLPMEEFSIERDSAYVLPVLKLAVRKNPDLLFFASPWSPPAWMKTNDSLCGGRIDPAHFASLARYLTRFIEAYGSEGIEVHAITPQNEPGYFPSSYPTCGWTGTEQRDFIRDHLGPALEIGGLKTEVWCYDHNFNNLEFASVILSDPEAARYVDGTAFHHYEGTPSAMTTLHARFPDKHIYFSEGSVFGLRGAAQIIAFLRNWARSYSAWVTLIDRNGQPNAGPHGCSPTCIVLDGDSLTLDYRFDYYMYGQFTKFIRPGAVRIESSLPNRDLPNVAVRNRDGSIVVVVANLRSASVGFAIEWEDQHLPVTLGGHSVATIRWPVSEI